MPVNTRSSSIARSTSPAGSDSSDVYYEDPVFDDAVSATAVQTTAMPTNVGLTTAVPAPDIPAATADDAYDTDAYETSAYETDTTTSVDDRDSTPTPVQGRNTSPASVIEISAEEFPALAAPVPAAAAAPRRKAGKKNKDKGKKRAIPEHTDDEDPFLTAAIADSLELASSARFEADTATATADSLGLTNTASLTTAGASSSRRGPGSPPKRVRTDSAGNAVPASRQGSPRTTPTASRSPFLAPVSTASTTAAVYTDTTAARARATHVAAPAAAIATPAAVPATVPATATFAAVAAAAPIVLPNLAQAPAAAVQRIVAANPVAAPAHLWPTADRNPPRGSYTAIPLGFTPIIYSRTLLMQGMPLNLMQLYNEVPHPKFFITVSGGNGVVLQTHGLIRESISDAINIGAADFQLGTPPTADNGTTSVLWLVAGIPEHLATTILSYPFLSSGRITIFPLPFDLPVNNFVGTLTGFTLPNSLEGAAVARNLIQTAIRSDSGIIQRVQTHRDAFGPHVSAERASEMFIDSVQVESIELLVGSTTTIAWQLFITPPTSDHDEWLNLRRHFGRLHVMTALHGSARMQRSFRCRICPAITHPTGLCPLPRLPGWLGPTLATITAIEEVSRQAATKALELIRGRTTAGPSNATSRNNAPRGQGPSNASKKPFKGDAKGKKGGDFKGKGKRREQDDFF